MGTSLVSGLFRLYLFIYTKLGLSKGVMVSETFYSVIALVDPDRRLIPKVSSRNTLSGVLNILIIVYSI